MTALQPNRMGCAEYRRSCRLIKRRNLLQIGVLGASGLSLADVLRSEAHANASQETRQNSIIILWMRGGPSQHETWDPKPDAPVEWRGYFDTTATNVPGIQICDFLPMSAGMMDKWSIIRSLHHQDAGHSAADQYCFTGYPNEGDPVTNTRPSCGSIVAEQLQHQNPRLPAYVMIPRNVPGTGPAYLGPTFQAFETKADPAIRGPFQIPNLALAKGLSLRRLDDRKSLLKDMDSVKLAVERTGEVDAVDRFQQRAWEIVTNPAARNAFDLDAEPAAIRERYGFMAPYKAPTPDRCGAPAWSQRFLLARRLVEAGVRLVTVDCRWWDTHVKGYESMRDGFLGRWDQAFTALLEDLEQRGLLESTMVLAWGEFGRTPRVNSTGGRDHYPHVFSAAMAGGGIQGGRVVGASDAKGAFPLDNPQGPPDVLATVYRHLGVNPNTHYLDNTGRPIATLPSGKPIVELF